MAKKIEVEHIPTHIALFMDGNGRWAKKRLLTRSAGHKAGAQALRELAIEADKIGLKYLTVYSFSTENWKRSQEEVNDLMNLMRMYIKQYIEDSNKNNLKMKIIGDISRLDKDLQEKILHLEEYTKDKTGLCVNIALNYGGRDEIVRAVKKIGDKLLKNELNVNDITIDYFSDQLDTKGIPDPDLLIRTSGEMRLSNFLLWQCYYTEFYFTDTLWPDFKIGHLLAAIDEYNKRSRRFGGR